MTTDSCTVEVGLLRKHPCGQAAVAKCANCEQPLCTKHAIAQVSAGRKTGKFLCAQCNAAAKLYDQTEPAAPAAATAPKPATTAQGPAAAPKPAAPAAKAAPAEKKSEPPPEEHSAPLEFTIEPKKPQDPKK